MLIDPTSQAIVWVGEAQFKIFLVGEIHIEHILSLSSLFYLDVMYLQIHVYIRFFFFFYSCNY